MTPVFVGDQFEITELIEAWLFGNKPTYLSKFQDYETKHGPGSAAEDIRRSVIHQTVVLSWTTAYQMLQHGVYTK